MKIPCPECKGKGFQDFYGSVHTREWCTKCGGEGKIDFVEKPRSYAKPVVCIYCGREDCVALLGESICGPL